MMHNLPPHRGPVAKAYAEVHRLREEATELRHQLHRANVQHQLANQLLAGVQHQLRAVSDMGLADKQEIIRLSGIIVELRANLLAATAPGACDQGGDGYKPGPAS